MAGSSHDTPGGLAPDSPVTESGGLLAPDFDMDWTTADREAHAANTKLAEEFMATIANKLAELGIIHFWNTPSSSWAQTQRQL